jgi:nucleoid-associated protein YgaU
MKKRYVLKNKRRFMIAMAIVISIISAVFLVAFDKISGYAEEEYSKFTVSRGDTMWDIVRETYGDETDVRKMISKLKRVNGMETTDIYEGQVLLLPDSEK